MATVVVVALGLLDAEMPEPRVRVFGVGFKKTGTTSFSTACSEMGLDEMSGPRKADLLKLERGLVSGDRAKAEAFFALVDRHECFQDSPFTNAAVVPRLAERYPDARFVLTRRNSTEWVGSARRWIAHKQPENANYGPQFWEKLGWPRGPPPSDADAEDIIVGHDRAVREYFSSRRASHRLLEIEFAKEHDPDQFWGRLCPFVGLRTRCPCPPVPLSNANARSGRR